MANRKHDKECLDIHICIDDLTDQVIVKYQANRIAREGLRPYYKKDAASDLFMELVRKEIEGR